MSDALELPFLSSSSPSFQRPIQLTGRAPMNQLPLSSSPSASPNGASQASSLPVTTTTTAAVLPISSLPPNVSIRAPTKANIHLLKRINSLLLPVSYPENFYREVLQNSESEILTRLAFYDDECVGGIRCRVETEAEYQASLEKLGLKDVVTSRVLQAISKDANKTDSIDGGLAKKKIYIMTLAVLSPYRSLSIGSHLLDYIVSTAARDPSIDADEAYAHVWVANDGALEFYRKQGFDTNSGAVVSDYYRRLEPRDARIVFRKISANSTK
ncbi:hypothetical protein TWF694_002216 [Orbilia ellipsospora]|uniref:N-acetyltransferase domain-containing protein n=1 Tax=Orbilia ellipsospora TaxID=2528407 RepID=A0AAV9X3W1_9PEZI